MKIKWIVVLSFVLINYGHEVSVIEILDKLQNVELGDISDRIISNSIDTAIGEWRAGKLPAPYVRRIIVKLLNNYAPRSIADILRNIISRNSHLFFNSTHHIEAMIDGLQVDSEVCTSLIKVKKKVKIGLEKSKKFLSELEDSRTSSIKAMVLCHEIETAKRPVFAVNYTDSWNNSLLFLAVRRGFEEIIKSLLSLGADPNYGFPLSVSGSAKITQDLLKAGARPNRRGFMSTETALSKVCSSMYTSTLDMDFRTRCSIVDQLLNFGADPNMQNCIGSSSLHGLMLWVGSVCCDKILVKMLLKKGANPNLKNNDGDTVLHLAVRELAFCHAKPFLEDIIRIFVKYGASSFIENNSGETPMSIVERYLEGGNCRVCQNVKKIMSGSRDSSCTFL